MTEPSGPPPDNQTFHRRAFHGVRVLLGRQAVIRGLGLVGALILARRLTAIDYGWFGIATFIVSLFAMFGDLGFASYFIHVDKAPERRDVCVSFTTQVIYSTVMFAAIWILAPWAAHFYKGADASTPWLIRALSAGIFIDLFRGFYRFQFERYLEYGAIARSDVAEALLYQVVAIALALLRFQAWTLVLGLLISETASAIILAVKAPAQPALVFDFRRMRELVPKAIRFQLSSPVNMLGEAATPWIIGMRVGPAGVGFLNWATPQARRPIVIVENVTRVSFPHFSRIKMERDTLLETLVTYLVGFVWVVLLWAVGLTAAGGAAIEVIYGERWLPAVPALLIFALALPLDSVSWLMAQAYAAVGRAMVSVYVIAIRSILIIGITIALVPRFDFVAMPIAYFAANLLTAPFLLWCFDRKLLGLAISRLAWIAIPTTAGIAIGRACLYWNNLSAWHPAIVRMLTAGVPAVLAYVGLSYFFLPARYRPDLHRVLHQPLTLFRRHERVRDELDDDDEAD